MAIELRDIPWLRFFLRCRTPNPLASLLDRTGANKPITINRVGAMFFENKALDAENSLQRSWYRKTAKNLRGRGNQPLTIKEIIDIL
ncbi:hypothetical protein A2188_02405 [Candidatus Woesebacteria bacterium RIFOXYA1_FULL_43_9]|uniref:Uncharacterized protein n=1 Tax=Candidatus Woesebacteria bacterium RIFOXYA1_FULL_43_9 TaxID=1802534 RepID=A0A1F8CK30_9BACT|nr:MAG: hypothetical protein A2188_02405 [Candidatus Woesebacteria bacterium RIFOXYA1_FULL_43_9]